MIKKLSLYSFLSAMVWITSYGQSQQQVWLKGKIINREDSVAVPFAQIASYKKLRMYAADSIGEFTVMLPPDDSIKILALGFEPVVVSIRDFFSNTETPVLFSMVNISYQIQQIDINAFSTYTKYSEDLKAIHTKAQEMDLKMPADIIMGKGSEIPASIRPVFARKPPIIAAFYNPLSYATYFMSNQEKEKRQLVKLFHQDKVWQLLTPEIIQEVSGLEGEKLQQFMIYCNVNIQLTDKDTNASVRSKVMELHMNFINEKKHDRKIS
ncbi:MAG: hypothetical protein JEZ14_06395 [Marinilabiliaceae bacterium]|nr:hypothetical protein [Marinilabiliaceae bacterium]